MPPDDDLQPAFDKLLRAAAGLPGVEAGTSYGTPALRVGKKLLCRVKDAGSVVLMAPPEEKEMLLAALPEVYYETAHYKGWPVLLARIDIIADDELSHRLAVTWRRLASRKLLKEAGLAQPPAP